MRYLCLSIDIYDIVYRSKHVFIGVALISSCYNREPIESNTMDLIMGIEDCNNGMNKTFL